MQDLSKIARPYASAAFQQASEEGLTAEWAEMLDLLVMVVSDPLTAGLLSNPKVDREQLVKLILDVCGERLSETGRNFVRVLAQYRRLGALRAIAAQYHEERSKAERQTDVEVISAYDLSESDRNEIIVAMTKRLGNKVDVKLTVDQSLIGGVVIRAGDTVIDGSMRGQLTQLARRIA